MDAAIVDLRLGDEDGLTLIKPLRALGARIRIVVLTGYASIATAVKAIKLGADDYLAKPVTASSVLDDATARREAVAAQSASVGAEPMSPRRLEWEHIHRVLAEHAGNISATARALKMHRRTLQRKLAKKPSAELVGHRLLQPLRLLRVLGRHKPSGCDILPHAPAPLPMRRFSHRNSERLDL